MAANFKTIDKVVKILDDEVGQEKTITLINRLLKETVPSGNSSYDETIRRIRSVICG